MLVFVTINNAGMKISVCVNVENWLIKFVCDKEFIWNPSNCDCEFDKSCDIGEYLDYSNCKCWKKSVDKLIEECTGNIEKLKLLVTMSIKMNVVLAHCTLCYFQ